MPKSRISIDWYQLLYMTKDQRLIKFFWSWYNTHKVKSKKRAARSVLIRYYSTNTTAPLFVLDAFRFNHDRKLAMVNLYE